MKKIKVLTLAAMTAAIFSGAHASAQTVNFQFLNDGSVYGHYAQGYSSVYTGTGVADDSGTYWNNNGTTSDVTFTDSNLLDSDGVTASGLTFSVNGYFDYGGGAPSGNALLNTYDYKGGVGNFSITGLNPGDNYALYLYSAGNGGGSTFTVDGVSEQPIGIDNNTPVVVGGVTTYPDTGGVTANSIPATAVGSYVEFIVNVDLSGEISGTYDQTINGFQVQDLSTLPVETPEPSTWAMMLIGVGALFGLRRIRRNA